MTDKHKTIPQWPHDLTSEIRSSLVESNRTLIVLDDDPTGTQTVHDVPVLTAFDEASLEAAISSGPPVLYVLTNSRALNKSQTSKLHRDLAERLRSVARKTDRYLELISRSDSTLRGYYPLETDTLADAWPKQADLTLVMPFFAEGGRITIDGQHYVCEGDEMIPAHETPFAKDAVFGYKNSYLPDWIEEKTRGRVRADEVVLISLEDIRQTGPVGVQKLLDNAPVNGVCVADAACDHDAAVVAAAIGQSTRRVLARSAASYVRARAGLVKQPLLTKELLAGESENGGLLMVGSHVPKTTAQLNFLLDRFPELFRIELSVKDAMSSPEQVVAEAVGKLSESLIAGRDSVLYTSREWIPGKSDNEQLRISKVISACVSDVVAKLEIRPRYLIAKGGITSSDIATKSLRVKLATVAGSILPGVPVWRLGEEAKFPGMHYVIFPGNVGEDDALAKAVEKLERNDQ